MLWDIFCNVIDNHGDIGVCWRLSAQLAASGQSVRLWVDDDSALAWMAPDRGSVDVRPWDAQASQGVLPGEVVIEAFGCELSPQFQQAIAAKAAAQGHQPAWINLEYLSAESFAQRSHGLPSPVLAGPAAGLTKYFYYPGFTPATGGLLREPGLVQRQLDFDRDAWLREQGIHVVAGARVVTLFCYEPPLLDRLLPKFAHGDDPVHLLVTAGRATAAEQAAQDLLEHADRSWNRSSTLAITNLPLLSQVDFDHLLWAGDFNFVRGEDSLVRALWAGKPMAWQAYPQRDDAHRAKLLAFLDWLEAPAPLREFHLAWNGFADSLPDIEFECWGSCTEKARQRLLAQEDLLTQLGAFVGTLPGTP
ncbi:MAG TPA: elongation factor P maturation arginine rhamnosyltransferase EarP [Ramlibacter sp.]|nr:elongation factor P maturation arginine rhamnosyltransferase EarP [Ramlibacter sp.]